MTPLSSDLELFVRERTGISPRMPLTADTRLEDDLDITGIEANQFMTSFFEHFQVDHGDYNADRYFVAEGSGLVLFLLTLLSPKRRHALERVTLTLGMLQHAVRLKRWDAVALE